MFKTNTQEQHTDPTMSTSVRKRQRAHSAAVDEAVDESNSWPSTKTSNRCKLWGCKKSPSTCSSERKFCGVMHRNLYMSKLADNKSTSLSPSPSPGQAGLTVCSWPDSFQQEDSEGNSPKCMLPECLNRSSVDPNTDQHFDFCCKKHMINMVERLTEFWSQQGRLCRLEDCCRHVYVEEDGQCHEYCNLNHAALAAARRGAMLRSEVVPSIREEIEKRSSFDHYVDRNVQDESDDQGDGATLESQIDSPIGYHHKLPDSELQMLLNGERKVGGVEACVYVQHGVDIYNFHPWELVTRFGRTRPRYFLNSFTKEREEEGQIHKNRKTKDGFSWKQMGRTHSNSNMLFETRYMSYQQGKGGDKKGKKCGWKMHEITLPKSSQTNCRRVIWMILDKAAVASCRQPDTSDGIIPAQNDVQIPTPSENEDGWHDALVTDFGLHDFNLPETSSVMTEDFQFDPHVSCDDFLIDPEPGLHFGYVEETIVTES